ncbi:glycosyltransferase family 1 protein [Subtercola vilae]|uniref:Glycosyltransferase family 1 protein n=1 Tax=Subtercola vilae TaxID=2056433 RepID=A0A4T2C3U5_9MICO|nr:glycosyltransferase family 1 protein [Subtercola vilae]
MVDAPTESDVPEGDRLLPLRGTVVKGSAGAASVAALAGRLRQIATVILPATVHSHSDAGELAAALARQLRSSLDEADIWLAIVGFSTVFPTIDEVRAVRRALALAAEGVELAALFDALEPVVERAATPDAPLELLTGATVVDANFSGRFDHNTGVQRVLRETVSRWNPVHPLALVCWNDSGTALRRLTGREVTRVTDWAAHHSLSLAERQEREPHDPARDTIVVPVRSVIVEIEVAQPETAAALAALAAVSGNRMGLVGHDMIPFVSAQGQASEEIERFARFLTVVKYAHRVSGVSASAAAEFEGFVHAVRAQGLPGPDVVAVPLAMNAPSASARSALGEPSERAAADQLPLVLVVGSLEPRKNHDAILFAARRLASSGARFRLRFIGGGGAAAIKRFDDDVRLARAAGLDVEVLRGANDTVLLDSYRQARFTAFPSLHEGFGLPVAESLALGTPVITSNHGSLAEIAEGGGCLTIDARDDHALELAMGRLLSDDEFYETLRAEALARTFRTWNDYAADLWAALVEPLAASIAARASGAATAHPEATARPAADADRLLAEWWQAVSARAAATRARENSLVFKARKVVPLARFFVARSREMGVPAASKAAWRVVRRRLVRG